MNSTSTERETRTSPLAASVDFIEPDNLQGALVRESKPAAEWTDEKHSLYLKSMETSFVNQLYNSIDAMGWCYNKSNLMEPKLIKEVHLNSPRPASSQFKVFRGDWWEMIDFERAKADLSGENECCNFTANPWIQHFRTARKPLVQSSSTIQESTASTSEQKDLNVKKSTCLASGSNSKKLHACHSHVRKDMVGSKTEMSDQNFVDDVAEGEKKNGKNQSKRMKTSISNDFSNDQVVPKTSYPSTEITTKN